MSQFAFYVDMNKCSGCRSCQVACKDRNDLPVGTLFRNVRTFEVGEYPDARVFHYSSTCNHCANPACVAQCPTGAMQKLDDGTVINDKTVCIGCGTCANVCPYEVPVIDSDAGVAQKCDACKSLRDAGELPVCVKSCLMRCIDFGTMEELQSKYGTNLVSDQAFLPDSSQTTPSLLIKERASIAGKPATQIIL